MIRAVSLIALFALASCASAEAPKVAVCDGKHRRPANPYGSVLPDAPLEAAKPVVAPTTRSVPAPADTPQTTPSPVSLIDPRSTYPCGRPA